LAHENNDHLGKKEESKRTNSDDKNEGNKIFEKSEDSLERG